MSTMDTPLRVEVLGAPVDAIDMQGALGLIDEHIHKSHRPMCVLSVNPEKVYALREADWLRAFFAGAGLLLPDGVGIVLASRCLFGIRMGRVPGADLMQRLCAQAAHRGHRVFLYGATEAVNRSAVDKLQKSYPGIKIVGRANGYRRPAEMDDLVQEINRAQVDILFVALGSPRQERWICEHLPNLTVKVCQGIGGTLDVVAGRVKRAPTWLRAAGMEWLYRLLCQPSRIWRQLRLACFAWEVIAVAIRSRMLPLAGRPAPGPTYASGASAGARRTVTQPRS